MVLDKATSKRLEIGKKKELRKLTKPNVASRLFAVENNKNSPELSAEYAENFVAEVDVASSQNKWTLQFHSHFLEDEYAVHHYNAVSRRVWRTLIFAALVYVLWALSDIYRYKDEIGRIMPMRMSVVGMALLSAAVTGIPIKNFRSYRYWQFPVALTVFLALVITIAVSYVQDPHFGEMDTTGFVIVLAGAIILLKLQWIYGFVVNNLFMILWTSVIFGVGTGRNDESAGDIASRFLPVAVAHFVFQVALFDNEVNDRQNFLRDTLLRCDVTLTKQENEDLKSIIDRLKENETFRQVDLDAPVEKMLTLLKDLESNAGITMEQKSQLRWMQVLLNTNVDIYTPDLTAQVAGGKSGLDANTSEWLLSHTTGAPVAKREPAGGGAGASRRSTVNLSAAATAPGGDGGSPKIPSLKPLGSQQSVATITASNSKLKPADDEAFTKQMTTWDFDIFRLEEAMPDGHLVYMTTKALKHFDLSTQFRIHPAKMQSYLETIEKGYWKRNAYHNATHATDVVQACFFFLTTCNMSQYFDPVDILALLLGAAIHDVDHPGLNNNFEIAVKSDKALLYNDRSPLENHHVSFSFMKTKNPDTNPFEGMASKDYVELRRVMIECVLATDLKEHFAIVSQFKNMVKSRPYDRSNKDDRALLLKCVIKCSDINNPTKKRAFMDKWTDRFLEETYIQGDKERELNLPISAFMDRFSPNVPKLEVGFIDFLVRPLYAIFDEFHQFQGPIHDMICKQLEENYGVWKSRQAENEAQNNLPGKPSK